jgi:serine protease Do
LIAIVAAWCGLAASGALAATDGALDQLEHDTLLQAVQKIEASVVQIRTVGGLEQIDRQLVATGPSTGLIVREDGYIVSSAFHFVQQPSSILVRLPDGSQVAARMVGRDRSRMLVLLKVDAAGPLPVARATDMATVRPGHWVAAVGRTFQADEVNLSVGVVSALKRMHGRAVQTDAATSTANYGGPLVDMHAGVIGVVVPMAPQSAGGEESELAGAEYYDSGIGFAIPLTHILKILPKWIDEGDLHRGLLGIGMESGNPHLLPPTITSIWPGSPAAMGGCQVGDRIVAVDGISVATQTQLRFQFAPRYAGEKLTLTLRPGGGAKDESSPQPPAPNRDVEVILADTLATYRAPFLGLLPDRQATRNAESTGVELRGVWPGSPAETAGLRHGDRITSLANIPVQTIAEARAALKGVNAGAELQVDFMRDEEAQQVMLTAATLPDEILTQEQFASMHAPPTKPEANAGDPDSAELDIGAIQLPDMPHRAKYYRPRGRNDSPSLLIWIFEGEDEAEVDLVNAWRDRCLRDGLVLVVARPPKNKEWSRDDGEYLQRLLKQSLTLFQPDPSRVVVGGSGSAGQLAYTLAFRRMQEVAGIVAAAAPLPRTLKIPTNRPEASLAVLALAEQNSPFSLLVQNDVLQLREAGYSASIFSTRLRPGGIDLATDARASEVVARWIDLLDRL